MTTTVGNTLPQLSSLHSGDDVALETAIAVVGDDAGLAALAEEWDALAGEHPFLNHTWTTTWWRHYRHARARLFIVTVRDSAGMLLGLAPWYVSDNSGQGRVIRFIGSGEVCADYLTIVAREADCQLVAAAVANWLAIEAADEWDLIEMQGIAQDDPLMEAWQKRLVAWGHAVYTRPDQSCWRAKLGTTWNDFLATLSKSRRERIRQLDRRSFATGRAQLCEVKNPQELERCFTLLIDLHQRRRQSLGQVGCFASAAFTAFHRDLCEQLLENGRLRMLWLEIEGRTAAVEYGMTGGDTVYYYQGGFDPEMADERPGWLSFSGSLHLAIDEGYRHFDFLRGDEEYKASWRAEPQPLVQVRIVGRRAAARVRNAAWRTGECLRGWARQRLGRGAGWSRLTRCDSATKTALQQPAELVAATASATITT